MWYKETVQMNERIKPRCKYTSWSLMKAADGYDDVVLAQFALVPALLHDFLTLRWTSVLHNLFDYNGPHNATKREQFVAKTTLIQWITRYVSLESSYESEVSRYDDANVEKMGKIYRDCKNTVYSPPLYIYFFVKQTKSVSRMGTIYLGNVF